MSVTFFAQKCRRRYPGSKLFTTLRIHRSRSPNNEIFLNMHPYNSE